MLKMFIQEGPQVAMDEALFSARMVSQHPDSEYWAKEFSKHYNVGYGKGQIKPPPGMSREMQSKIGIQNIPGGGRRAMKNLAKASLILPGALGTAASAQETGMRMEQAQETNDPADWLQYAISAASTGTDAFNLEPVSAGLDATQMAIDDFRDPELAAESRAKYSEDYEKGSTQMAEQAMGVSQGNAPTQTFTQGGVDQMVKKVEELPGQVMEAAQALPEQALNWVHTQGLKLFAGESQVGLTGNDPPLHRF